MNTKPAIKQTLQIQKQPTEELYIKTCSINFLQYSQENTCVGVSFIAALKGGYLVKKRTQQRCFPVNIRTYFDKQLRMTASVHSVSKQEKWEMENIKLHKHDVSGIFRSSISEMLKIILVLDIFSNSKVMYLVKFTTI